MKNFELVPMAIQSIKGADLVKYLIQNDLLNKQVYIEIQIGTEPNTIYPVLYTDDGKVILDNEWQIS
jgi:hypothetical protein